MENLLSAVLLSLLLTFSIWFIWPVVVDPLLRRLDRFDDEELSSDEENSYENWMKRGARVN